LYFLCSLHDAPHFPCFPTRRPSDLPGASSSQPMVSLESVTMAFGDFVAVENVNIAVQDGEFVSIVGPTGCGKSTILNAVAGLLQPSRGAVQIDGRSVSGLQRNVGYLFQQDSLLPWKTAQENIELGLQFRGMDSAERRARGNEWLAKVGLKQ